MTPRVPREISERRAVLARNINLAIVKGERARIRTEATCLSLPTPPPLPRQRRSPANEQRRGEKSGESLGGRSAHVRLVTFRGGSREEYGIVHRRAVNYRPRRHRSRATNNDRLLLQARFAFIDKEFIEQCPLDPCAPGDVSYSRSPVYGRVTRAAVMAPIARASLREKGRILGLVARLGKVELFVSSRLPSADVNGSRSR